MQIAVNFAVSAARPASVQTATAVCAHEALGVIAVACVAQSTKAHTPNKESNHTQNCTFCLNVVVFNDFLTLGAVARGCSAHVSKK